MARYLNTYTRQFKKITQTVSLSIFIIINFTAKGQTVSKKDASTVSMNYMYYATGKIQSIVNENEIFQ